MPVGYIKRTWTAKEDAAIRKHYPVKGPGMCEMIDRSRSATQKRASKLGVTAVSHRPRSRGPIAASAVITEELIQWAADRARHYARRFGDPEDRFGACTSMALVKAQRAFSPSSGLSWEKYARGIVISKLELAKIQGGVSGYRRANGVARKDGAPSVYSLSVDDDDQESGVPPVGWELEYADYVQSLARKMPGIYEDVIRLMYLDCRGLSVADAAKALKMTRARTAELHREAIEKLRGKVMVLPREAMELLGEAC